MRLLLAILVLCISIDGFAQARAAVRSSGAKSKYPLHSTLHLTPTGRVGIQGDLGFVFGSSTLETLNSPGIGQTATDENEINSFITQIDLSYGVLPQLEIGLELGYASSTQKNVSYRDTAGNINVPLEPDAKSKGLYDPEVYATFRPIESDLVIDLGGSLRLGFMSSERGTPDNTDLDVLGRADSTADSNNAEGSYGLTLGARAGYRLTERLNLAGAIKGEYNFAGTTTAKSSLTGETNLNQDAYLETSLRGEAEYFLTPEFAIMPFINLVMTPKRKYNFMQGAVNSKLETAGFKTYSVGILGSYLLQSELALKAGYGYSSPESAKVQSSTNGAAFVDVSNSKDRESHSLIASIAYEF